MKQNSHFEKMRTLFTYNFNTYLFDYQLFKKIFHSCIMLVGISIE